MVVGSLDGIFKSSGDIWKAGGNIAVLAWVLGGVIIFFQPMHLVSLP